MRIGNAFSGNNLYVDLDSFPGMRHLLVRFRFVRIFLLDCHEPLTLQNPIQGFNAPGVSSLSQLAPEFNHAEFGISSPHIVNELQFFQSMLIRVMMWPTRSGPQRLDAAVPAIQPEIDV
jgi:hypothetical protein